MFGGLFFVCLLACFLELLQLYLLDTESPRHPENLRGIAAAESGPGAAGCRLLTLQGLGPGTHIPVRTQEREVPFHQPPGASGHDLTPWRFQFSNRRHKGGGELFGPPSGPGDPHRLQAGSHCGRIKAPLRALALGRLGPGRLLCRVLPANRAYRVHGRMGPLPPGGCGTGREEETGTMITLPWADRERGLEQRQALWDSLVM